MLLCVIGPHLGYQPKLKHGSFSRNFLVFHCVNNRQSSVTSQIISLISQVVFFTQVLKVVKARYQFFSALLFFLFIFRQKCITCKILARILHGLYCLARVLQGVHCLENSCTTYMFCKILARILQVMYNFSPKVFSIGC